MAKAKATKAAPPTKAEIEAARERGIIVTPLAPAKAPRIANATTPLSASQARRLIRDLEWFVKSGELTEVQYEAKRAVIVARMQ